MEKQKIVIVGGSGTIGSAIAKEVLYEGFTPHIIGRNKELIEENAHKLNCPYSIADVLETEKLISCLAEIDNVYGVAYCVGSIDLKPIHLAKENDYLHSYKLNTVGAIFTIKALLPKLRQNKGSILLFSTVAVQQGFNNHTIISTAKGAIEGLTLSLAAELSPNIRVNCIAPSLTESKMSKTIISNEKIKKAIEDLHPIPKIGEANDYSKLSAFLLGKNNTWITGQIIHIDGGRSTVRKKS